MRSIRQRLLILLLAALGTLWLVTGIAVYVTVRHSLEGQFDAELNAMASEVRYLLPEHGARPAGTPSAYWFDFYQPDSGLYFEVWDEYLLFVDRSPSLGDLELPRPDSFGPDPVAWAFTLGSGEKVRAVARQFSLSDPVDPLDGAGTPQEPINVIVARNRDDLDGRLSAMLAATALVGILIVPLSFWLVRISVGWGLTPLRRFAERVSGLGIDSLDQRFPTTHMPAELKPVSERLNGLLERLEAGLERERRLNADLAHELRTPIAELKAMAELALTWPDKIDATQYREVLDVAGQMQAVIEGMLLLARCEQGAEKPERHAVPFFDLLEACWSPFEDQAATKALHVHRDIPPGTLLDTSPDLFQILLSNLLSNAVAYCPAGGSVAIEASGNAQSFALSIANTVESLSADDIPRLFDRFWRHDAARTGGAGHAGLGLPLAKACAEVLDLTLSVEYPAPSGMIVFQVKADLVPGL